MSRHQVPVSSLRKAARRGVLAAATFVVLVALNDGSAAAKPPSGSSQPDFGAERRTSSTRACRTSQIQATVDAIAAQQVDDEMGSAAVRAAVQAGHLRQRRAAR